MPRQTIQIFLPASDPRGMRVAEITTRIVRVIEVPRSQLADFLKMPEAQQVGVYFLMGELSEAGLPRLHDVSHRSVRECGQQVGAAQPKQRLLEPRAGGHLAYQQHDANARAVSGMVRHCGGHQGRALQPGERQHRLAALHPRAAAGRLPRNSRNRRHPAGHAGPAHL
jgi:non-ribosomal peptide synthetase component F